MRKRKKDSSGKDTFLDYFKIFIVAGVIAVILNNFVILNATIPSQSMEKTIMTGDRILGSRLTYLMHDPQRYDIVVFKYPDDESQLFIKRVIGLPGEKVEIIDGKVYIDDAEVPLDDSFTPEPAVGNWGPHIVPKDYYFMLGDNRNNSKDSRYWENTYVRKDKILGKAKVRYFPKPKVLE